MAWDYEQVFNLWNDIANVLQANVYVPLAIIICDKLEWERKIEEQGIHVWYEIFKVLKLANLCGTQNGKQSCKRKLRARYSWLTWRLQYQLKACSTFDGIHMTSKGYENET